MKNKKTSYRKTLAKSHPTNNKDKGFLNIYFEYYFFNIFFQYFFQSKVHYEINRALRCWNFFPNQPQRRGIKQFIRQVGFSLQDRGFLESVVICWASLVFTGLVLCLMAVHPLGLVQSGPSFHRLVPYYLLMKSTFRITHNRC